MRKKHTGNTVVADKEPAKLLPKVIMYDKVSGAPIHALDVRAATDQEANISTLPWKEWLRGSVAKQSGEQPTHMAAIQLVPNSLHTRGHIDQAPLDVSIDWHTKRKVVKASEDLLGGSLALPPCVPYVSHVRQELASTPRAHNSDREVRSGGQEARHTCEREGGLRTVSELILRASRVHDARREQGYN